MLLCDASRSHVKTKKIEKRILVLSAGQPQVAQQRHFDVPRATTMLTIRIPPLFVGLPEGLIALKLAVGPVC